MKGAGAKLVQFLSMLAFQRERSEGALGTLRDGARAVPIARVRNVVERELDAPIRELFRADATHAHRTADAAAAAHGAADGPRVARSYGRDRVVCPLGGRLRGPRDCLMFPSARRPPCTPLMSEGTGR
jgi:hypothetical protein